MGLFTPNVLPISIRSSSLVLIWLGVALLSAFYIVSHGVDYVGWPRLIPSYREALNWNGKAHESGRHGRAGRDKGLSQVSPSRTVGNKTEMWRRQSVQEVELGQKKRLD